MTRHPKQVGGQRPVALLLAVAAMAGSAAPADTSSGTGTGARAVRVEDYFHLRRVTELALSSDGRWLAYATEIPVAMSGGSDRRLYLRSLTGETPAAVVDELSNARRIDWIPGTHELAFLRVADGKSQVFSYEAGSGDI